MGIAGSGGRTRPDEVNMNVCVQCATLDGVSADLVSVEIDRDAAAAIVEKHNFDTYAETGPLHFRRHGKTGVWRGSDNFTHEVECVARNILGLLRGRLGYKDT